MGHKKVFPRGGEGDDTDSELLNGYLVGLYETLALGHTVVDENGIDVLTDNTKLLLPAAFLIVANSP